MIERSKIIEKDDSEYGKEYVLLSDARTYGDQRAAEAREQMREECVNIVEGSSAITFEVTSELVQAIKELL